jgi:protein SCO1
MPRGRSLLALLPCAALLAGGCGGSSDKSATASSASRAPSYDAPGTIATHAAPALALRNYDGRAVDLRQYRGKAVLVTFIYSHCPDVCPLIVGHLHGALAQLGPQAKKLRIVAVSTDPRGDTLKTVRAFLKAHDMTGKMDFLIGSAKELGRVWSRWGIVAKRDKKTPELVEHSALIYGITASGKITVAYPSNFKPKWIVHDVPLLAAR